jgi:hypothetical protein
MTFVLGTMISSGGGILRDDVMAKPENCPREGYWPQTKSVSVGAIYEDQV